MNFFIYFLLFVSLLFVMLSFYFIFLFTCNLLFNSKIIKKGSKISAVVEGYHYCSTYNAYCFNIKFSPIVSFINNDNKKIIIKLSNREIFPFYKKGSTLQIKYIKSGSDDVIPFEFYNNFLKNSKVEKKVNLNYKGILFDFKYFIFLCLLFFVSFFLFFVFLNLL